MPRCIKKSHLLVSKCKIRLLGKNGNPPASLQRIRVQKRISVVNSSKLPDLTGKIKDSFRKRRLSGIHMRQDPDRYILFWLIFRCCCHRKNAPFCS